MKTYFVSWVEKHEAEIEADSEQAAIDAAVSQEPYLTLAKSHSIVAEVISGTCAKCEQDYEGSNCDCQTQDSMDLAKRSEE